MANAPDTHLHLLTVEAQPPCYSSLPLVSSLPTLQKTRFNEKEARDTCRALLKALDYIHSRNVVHHDLKPENVLLASKSDCASIRLADFGFACGVSDELSTDCCGTPFYMAPEIIQRKLHGTVSARRVWGFPWDVVTIYASNVVTRVDVMMFCVFAEEAFCGEAGEGACTVERAAGCPF